MVVAWAAAAGIVVALTTTLLARAAESPAAADPTRTRIPADIMWMFVNACTPDTPVGETGSTVPFSFSLDPDGTLTVQFGYPDVDDHSITGYTLDAGATAVANECLGGARFEDRDSWRPPTPGEKLLIYDWVYRWEVPCLAGQGHRVWMPQYAELVVDEYGYAAYMLPAIAQFEDIDFDGVLASRTACSPIPPFLRDAGVGP